MIKIVKEELKKHFVTIQDGMGASASIIDNFNHLTNTPIKITIHKEARILNHQYTIRTLNMYVINCYLPHCHQAISIMMTLVEVNRIDDYYLT